MCIMWSRPERSCLTHLDEKLFWRQPIWENENREHLIDLKIDCLQKSFSSRCVRQLLSGLDHILHIFSTCYVHLCCSPGSGLSIGINYNIRKCINRIILQEKALFSIFLKMKRGMHVEYSTISASWGHFRDAKKVFEVPNQKSVTKKSCEMFCRTKRIYTISS